MVIKYLGSKRTLIPHLSSIAQAVAPRTAVDLFTGTTRVAQAFKRLGITTTATDLATYAEVFAKCYITTDARVVDQEELGRIIGELNALPGKSGYFTKTFCEDARYFQPKNGARVDAIREHIERHYAGGPYYPILLTALIEAADRVDSTVGLQMAYLKAWAARANQDMVLRVPELLPGVGHAARGDALNLVQTLPHTDLMYLDPPYNQHRYNANYHIWSSLVQWDKPATYGIANKRVDLREDVDRSSFNRKAEMPLSMAKVIADAKADTLVVSYNNEGWVDAATIEGWLHGRGVERVARFDFDFKRHVGAQIGIHNLAGEKVGTVSHTRNLEHVFVAGSTAKVTAVERALT